MDGFRAIRPIALALPLLLAACATRPHDCTDAIDAARSAGATAAWLDPVLATAPAACRSAATATWLEAAGALDCAPRHAFVAARLDAAVDADCSVPAYRNAERLGRMIGELERERDSIERALAGNNLTETARRDFRQRLVVIQRDLPQLLALAQFDELERPATVPDRPRD